MERFYGVPDKIIYQNNERVDELNDRIRERQFSDRPLAPNFNARPINTKYSRFPIIDRRANENVPIYQKSMHSVTSNFNPATRNGPPDFYFNNVDTETMLRNQNVALQKGANQGIYVPSSNSDLYRVNISNVSEQNTQAHPHPHLFNGFTFTNNREQKVNSINIGKDIFNNHTRTQLRNI